MRIRNIVIVFVLGMMLIIRLLQNEVAWVISVSYFGVIVSYVDLYIVSHDKYKKRRGFGFYSVVFFIGFLIIISVLVLEHTGLWQFTNKQGDCYTILALLISLPRDLYVSLLGKVLKEKEDVANCAN